MVFLKQAFLFLCSAKEKNYFESNKKNPSNGFFFLQNPQFDTRE